MGETDNEAGRYRLSIFELGIWMIAVSVLLALPSWLGDSAVQYGFYGTLAVVTWRLSRVMPTIVAVVIAVMASILVSAFMVTWLQQ